MIRNSMYWSIYNRKDERLHLGFKYKGKILKKTLSNQMFGANPVLDRAHGMTVGEQEHDRHGLGHHSRPSFPGTQDDLYFRPGTPFQICEIRWSRAV